MAGARTALTLSGAPETLRNLLDRSRFPDGKNGPTKEVPNAAEPGCLQIIDVPSGSLGHTLPRPAASDSRNDPGKLACDVTGEINSPARWEATYRRRCAAPRSN